MSEPKERISTADKWDWLWRIGATLLLVANLFLKANYVDLTRYEKDHADMASSIADLTRLQYVASERDKVNDRQDEQLRDHEARLRVIESKLPH